MSRTFLFFCIFIHTSLPAPPPKLGRAALDNFPLVDGHNDLPWNLYSKLHNQIGNFSFDKDLSNDPLFGFEACSSCFTDLERAKQGKLGAQDLLGWIARYVRNAYVQGIEEAFGRQKIGSLIGLEGGHSIDNRLSLLRQYYELGVRYMTLTHSCNLRWADASPVDDTNPILDLTDFGEKVVLEMNRLGMLVDLSHVSHGVMSRTLDVTEAPIIFSHSSSYAVYAHHRNVRDDILRKVTANKGVVMVNFYSAFIGNGTVTINDVIEHINHIADVAGVDHVGIGSDYDGVSAVPQGLEDVSKFVDLFDKLQELNPERWTIENLEKLAGRNLVRVFKEVESVRDKLQATTLPAEDFLPEEVGDDGVSFTISQIVLLVSAMVFLFN